MIDPDGPWRVADRVRVVVHGLAEPPGAVADRVAAELQALGLTVLDAPSVRSADVATLLPSPDDGGFDVLLVDADTATTPKVFAELRRVADDDPMLLAVMPRFLGVRAADHPAGSGPRAVDYAVLPDLRCLYVKGVVLAQMSEAALDVMGRLLGPNRFGFRIATARHALARHPAGPLQLRADDAPTDLRPALARHLASAPAAADRLLLAMTPEPDGRHSVAFDLGHLGPGHSGTSRLAAALIRRAAARWTDLALHAVASEAAFAAHLGDLGTVVTRVDPSDPRRFAAAIRFGQPFLWSEVDALARRAPVLVVFLLDTIGFDCLAHAPDELDALWRFVCGETDGLLFNSAFTERQFERRFTVRAGLPRRTSLHSLDLAEYCGAETAEAATRATVLVVGNGFPHKRLRETADLLGRAGLADPVTVLGLDPGAADGVTGIRSGNVAPERLAALYAAAKVVVYPSVYEGFGFPILEALAHRRPVLVRPLPPYAEIAAALPEAGNIHAYADDADLVRRLHDPPSWREAPRTNRARSWDDAADDLRAVLDAAMAGVERSRIIRRIDLLRGRMAYMRTHPIAGDGTDTLDRLAGAAGRFAQSAVTTLGRRLPGALRDLAARVSGRGR